MSGIITNINTNIERVDCTELKRNLLYGKINQTREEFTQRSMGFSVVNFEGVNGALHGQINGVALQELYWTLFNESKAGDSWGVMWW